MADLSSGSVIRSPPLAVVNFRTDERSEQALAELTADGSTVSDAIRQALVDAVRPAGFDLDVSVRSRCGWPSPPDRAATRGGLSSETLVPNLSRASVRESRACFGGLLRFLGCYQPPGG